jgi:hypothetical protein
MINHTIQLPGRYYRNFGYPGSMTHIESEKVRTFNILQVIHQQEGDRKNPNRQVYHKEVVNSWRGRIYKQETWGYVDDQYGDMKDGLTPLSRPDVSTFLYNACLSKTYDQIRGSIDLAVELGQAGQTIGMMRGAVKVLRFAGDLVRSVKQRRPVGVIAQFLTSFGVKRDFDRTKTVAELWLEYQYGWKPLVQTVYDCVDQLMTPSRRDDWPLLVLKSRKRVLTPISTTRPSPQWGSGYNETIVGHHSSRGEMMTQWRIPPSRLLDLAGWTSLNPAGLAWELLPYSFVVDWFVDVGGWVRNLESACLYRSSYVRGYWTLTHSTEMASAIRKTMSNGFVALDADGVYRDKDRAVLTNVFPRTPSFSPKLGPERLLSAAGLLAGFLGVRRPRGSPQGTADYLT